MCAAAVCAAIPWAAVDGVKPSSVFKFTALTFDGNVAIFFFLGLFGLYLAAALLIKLVHHSYWAQQNVWDWLKSCVAACAAAGPRSDHPRHSIQSCPVHAHMVQPDLLWHLAHSSCPCVCVGHCMRSACCRAVLMSHVCGSGASFMMMSCKERDGSYYLTVNSDFECYSGFHWPLFFMGVCDGPNAA